ncbi:hypothetical protein GOC13_23070 [Sinorhizobium meliloti]|nr:hypothetical protein [Sinorhizobium meliloti]MDX0270639.1 hypothetical protein [Sinorhizobium meliloti]
MRELVERLRERANDSRDRSKPFNLMLDAAAEIERLSRRAEELEAALKPFMWGDDAVCEIFFGEFPDEKSMTFTIPLGDFRRARAAIRKRAEEKP